MQRVDAEDAVVDVYDRCVLRVVQSSDKLGLVMVSDPQCVPSL
jgi:hypothetical protein